MEVRPLLERLEEDGDELAAALAYVASRAVGFDDDELRAARRRGVLLLATGGDPRRELDPDGRPVASVAADLETPARRVALLAALRELESQAAGLPRVGEALAALLADGDVAWRWLACALLADELTDTGDE